MNWVRIMLSLGLLAGADAARAQSPWYGSLGLGAYQREDSDGSTTFFINGLPGVTSPGTRHTTYDPGPFASVAIGYRLPLPVRLEAEFAYATFKNAQTNPIAANQTFFPTLNGQTFTRTSGGENSRYIGTVNAFYDILTGTDFSPYVGAGFGGAHSSVNTTAYFSAGGSRLNSLAASSDRLVALVEGGIGYAFSEAVVIAPGYRYIRYFAGSDQAAHVFKVNLRYSF